MPTLSPEAIAQARANFPRPRVPSPTKTRDWQIGGQQDTSAKIQSIFAGQAPAFATPDQAASTPTPTPNPSPRGRLQKRVGAGSGRKFGSGRVPIFIPAIILAVVMIAILVGFVIHTTNQPASNHLSINTDFTQLDAPPVIPCASPEATLTVTSVEASISAWQQTYQKEPADDGYQQVFDSFLQPALAATGFDCLMPYTCRQVFADLLDAQVSLVHHSFSQDLNYVVGRSEPVTTFYGRLYGLFGTRQVDLTQFSEVAYDADAQEFTIAKPSDKLSNYAFNLQEVWWRPDNTQMIFVADAQPIATCQLTLTGHACTCPHARYYLVMNQDKTSGLWFFSEHLMHRLTSLTPLDPSNSTN